MATFPPKRSLPDADFFFAKIMNTEFPKLWVRPREWNKEVSSLEKQLQNVKDLKPLSSKEKFCLVKTEKTHGLHRGVVMSFKPDGKYTILLIDSGCEMEFSVKHLFKVPKPSESEQTAIMEHPIFCAEVSWDKGGIIRPEMKSFAKTYLMGLPSVKIASGSDVGVIAGIGDIVEKMTTLYTDFSLSLMQLSSSSSQISSLPVIPSRGEILCEEAMIIRFKSSDKFTMEDLASGEEFLCSAGKSSKKAKKRFEKFYSPNGNALNEGKIFFVVCDGVLDCGRCLVTLTNMPQDLMGGNPYV